MALPVTAEKIPALVIDGRGWCDAARPVISPHCDARPPGCIPELLVVHNISLPPGCFGGDAIENLFLGTLDCLGHPYYQQLRGLRVSSHFLIRRDGALTQFVSCRQRAWHAGISRYGMRTRCNDFSIGIELEGTDHQPFETQQYLMLAELARALKEYCPLRAVTGHSDIAPGRKSDPGEHFDWPGFLQLARLDLPRYRAQL